VTEGKTG
jgi:hypothetical protein